MKLIYRLAVVALILGLPHLLLAQKDTLAVEWSENNLDPIVNALSDAVANDTLTAADTAGTGLAVGDRVPNRVYKLLKGGYYWNTNRIDGTGFHLDIVGEPSDPEDGDFGNPPVIIRVVRDDYVDGKTIVSNASVTLKNLYIIGSDDAGDQTAYQPIELSGNGNTYLFENNIFEKTNFANVAFTGAGNDIIFRDNIFRNLLGRPSTQQWEGRGISVWTDQESIIIENNTFFNVEFTAFQLEGGAANFVLVNHNTFVNIGRQPFTGGWWREAYFTNNLFYNTWYHGETPSDLNDVNRDEGRLTTGNLVIDALPSAYGPEEGRRIAVTNNISWMTNDFDTFYSEDTITTQPLIANLEMTDYFDVYTQMTATDNAVMDPGLNTTFSSEQYGKMIQNIRDLRAGVTPATDFMWMVATLEAEECYSCPVWPLPEDFSYTADLTGNSSDGLPVGDLKWFPADKATYDANREQYHQSVTWLAGPKIALSVQDEQQAEDATLGGDAEIVVAEGESYYQLSAGYIKWEFDLAQSGQMDIDVLVDLNNRATSGVNFFVNDNEVHDPRGWGQYVFGIDADNSVYPDFPASGLEWWLITQEQTIEFTRDGSEFLVMNEGANTIEIKASWCDNGFGGINIYEAGTETLVKSLTAVDVTDYQFAEPKIIDADYVPVWFKSVHTNTGSVTFSLNAPEDGTYRLALSFQNTGTEVVADVNTGGTTVGTATMQSDPEGGAVNVLSSAFELTAGAHEIEVDVAGINLDFAQLVLETVTVNNLDKLDNRLERFELSQNYPNPFNPTTNINFSLGKTSKVKLTIFNVLGQRIATLVNNKLTAGNYSYEFDASHLASGLYIYRIEAGDFTRQKKMMLIK